MKLFGYAVENNERQRPMQLSEASIVASPVELMTIAKVLTELAVEMEREGFDHVHLSDRISSIGDGPELVVVKAE